MKKMCYVFLGLMLLTGTMTSVHAQEIDESEIAFGVVQSVGIDSLELIDADEGVEIIFKVNADTVFENVALLSDILEGDTVYVDYLINGHANIAVNIYKVMEDDEYIESVGDITEDIEYIETNDE